MGMVKKLSNQLDLDGNKILKEMMSGDYENLIQDISYIYKVNE